MHRLLAHKFEHRGRFADYAILYRGNHQSRVFETALRAQSIPYVVSGGQSYFERAEIKDLVAYLRLIANDDDDPAFLRAVSTPKRGIGQTTLARLSTVAGQRHESLFAAVFAPEFEAGAHAKAREELQRCCALVNDLRHRAPREPAGRCSTSWSRGSATRTGCCRRSTSARPNRSRRACAISSLGWRARASRTARPCSSSRR